MTFHFTSDEIFVINQAFVNYLQVFELINFVSPEHCLKLRAYFLKVKPNKEFLLDSGQFSLLHDVLNLASRTFDLSKVKIINGVLLSMLSQMFSEYSERIENLDDTLPF